MRHIVLHMKVQIKDYSNEYGGWEFGVEELLRDWSDIRSGCG